ncbi:MAG: hypothetical protein JWL63_1109 [Rhodocyclales bacterium]|nr:hypothetical protein [Rhodocyclales bacterium]
MKVLKKTFLAAALIVALAGVAQAKEPWELNAKESRVALGPVTAQLAKTPDNVEALKTSGILLQQIARSDAKREDVEQAERNLKRAKELAPADQEIAAWLGSVTTMKALFETDPGRQTLWVKVGTKLMDAAVQGAPNNLVVRLVRANNSVELPPFLRRARFGVEDFAYYLDACARQTCSPTQVEEAKQKLKQAQQLVAQAQ